LRLSESLLLAINFGNIQIPQFIVAASNEDVSTFQISMQNAVPM
jgi:hypothetical protein